MQSCDGEREVWYVTVDYAPVVSECFVFKEKRTEKNDGMDENVCSVVMFKNWSFLRYRMVRRTQAVYISLVVRYKCGDSFIACYYDSLLVGIHKSMQRCKYEKASQSDFMAYIT